MLAGWGLFFETVMIPVENGCDCRDLFREHLQVQCAVALLDHAAQQASAVDAPSWVVDGTAIPPDFANVALAALVLGHKLFTKHEIGVFELCGLGMGRCHSCGNGHCGGANQHLFVKSMVFHEMVCRCGYGADARLTLNSLQVNKSMSQGSVIRLSELSLDAALSLVQQAGVVLPPPSESPTRFVQTVLDGLCNLSSHDALTGLDNRRSFLNVLERELDRVARSGDVALLLLVDIDHFKKVNDTHGHLAGDSVLRQVAQRLHDCVRPMDSVARYGGEEFAVVLPNCSHSYGLFVAERVRQAMQARPFPVSTHLELDVTVSVGGAYAPQWIRSAPAIWIERTDRQLYRAKHEGRNRVCLEEVIDTVVSTEEKELLYGALNLDMNEPHAGWSQERNG